MELMTAQDWATLYLGLIFIVTGANILVLYLLNGGDNPIPGLGMYTVSIFS